MNDHLPLSLERTAMLRARVDRGERLDAVLAAEGLALEHFERALRGWLARIGAEVSRKRYGLSQRYQKAYLTERTDVFPVVEEESGDVDATGVGIVFDFGAILPFSAHDDATPKPPPTTEIAAPAPPPIELSAAKAARAAIDETRFVTALSDADLEPLPFATAASGSPEAPKRSQPDSSRTPAVEAAPREPARQADTRPASDIDATAFVSALDIEDALPFQGSASPPPPAAREAEDLAGGTAFVPALTDADLGLDVAPKIPLERYASLLVDLEAGDVASVLTRYGLDPLAFEAERRAWQPRLADSNEAARLRDAMQRYRAWLASR